MSDNSKAQAVKLKWKTVDKLKNLEISISWVELSTYDDKINHLMWFYENNKDNDYYKIK